MSEKKSKKSGFIKFLKWVGVFAAVGVAMLLFIVLVMPFFQGNYKYYGKVDPTLDSKNWMAEVEDDMPLNLINLPGTHDSSTQYVQLAFFSKCQNKSIGEQLEMGYRYLDMRLAIEKAENGSAQFKTMHGFTNCRTSWMPWAEKLYLDNVLEDCYEFLDKHPTETIVFCVKQERGDESVTEVQELLNTYVEKNASYWYTENKVPTLGEVRGKIVLARRYPNEANLENAGLSLQWEDQGSMDIVSPAYEVQEVEDQVTLWVQDRYKYDENPKWTAFEEGLKAKPLEKDEEAVFINFMSTNGATTYGHPYKYIKVLNASLWAENLEKGTSYGWMIVDYGTEELAQHIYETNLK